jgi:hypothetical protein
MNLMNFMENNTEKIFYFISQECGVSIQKLSLQTTLLGDIGIDGCEAVEFFEKFSQEFEVDMSEFDIDKHFGSEGYPLHILLLLPIHLIIFVIRYLLHLRDIHEIAGFTPITIADLVKAAESGKWHNSGSCNSHDTT